MNAVALLQHDDITGRPWLAFPRMPPLEIRRALLREGWRYHGGLRAWQHDNPGRRVPAGITYGDGGACNYSTIRPRGGDEVLAILARARGAATRNVRYHHPGSSPMGAADPVAKNATHGNISP